MIDKQAFRSLSYGLYIIGAEAEGQRAGCVVNTLVQVTSSPAQVSVAINKDNVTAGVVQKAGRFTAAVLTEDAPMELIGTFGFKCSADVAKFDECAFDLDAAQVPYVNEHIAAWLSVRVVETVDVGTHLLFIGEVEQAQAVPGGAPMTYAYYHLVKGGKTPPKASSFEGDAQVAQAPKAEPVETAGDAEEPKAVRYGWQCMVCGYIVEMDELPDDFECPVCGVGKEMFERIEL